MKDVIPEVYLETRRKKKNGLYPVKLRIIYNRQPKYYPVNIDLSIEQFESITQSKRPPIRLVKEYTRIYKEQGRALEIISSMKAFDFYSFEKKFTSRSYGSNSVKQYFKDRIVSLQAEDRVGTADSYEQTLNSLLRYQAEKYKRDDIKFQEVNISWLQSYERFMIQNEFSYATIGVLLFI